MSRFSTRTPLAITLVLAIALTTVVVADSRGAHPQELDHASALAAFERIREE